MTIPMKLFITCYINCFFFVMHEGFFVSFFFFGHTFHWSTFLNPGYAYVLSDFISKLIKYTNACGRLNETSHSETDLEFDVNGSSLTTSVGSTCT